MSNKKAPFDKDRPVEHPVFSAVRDVEEALRQSTKVLRGVVDAIQQSTSAPPTQTQSLSNTDEEKELFKKASGNDPTSAAVLWTRLAEGSVSNETALAWLRHIAPRIVDDVVNFQGDHASRRTDAALRAIGLSGKKRRIQWLEEAAEMIESSVPELTDKEAAQLIGMIETDPLNPSGPFDADKAEGQVRRARQAIHKRQGTRRRRGTRKKSQVPPKE